MRIALCCQEALFCDALAAMLNSHGRFQVVANEPDLRNLINAAKQLVAHVIIVDSSGLDSNDVQFLLGARAFGDFTVILIGNGEDLSHANGAVDRIITRKDTAAALFHALLETGGSASATRPVVREGRKPYGVREDNVLSRREYEVAQLVAKGMSNRRVAQVTGLREQSVKNLVSVIMRKLHCENRVQVALKLVNAPVAESS